MIDLETLVPMPDYPAFTDDDMATMRANTAREVAKRCAEICEEKAGTSEYDDSTSRHLALDIAAEFGLGDV